MAEKKPARGAGDVVITLDGKEHTLVPSLDACERISALAGGAQHVIERLANLDFHMICDVIALGTGFTSGPQRKLLAEAVYKTGTIRLFGDCILFVRIVNHGGQLPDDDEEVGAEEAEAPLSPSKNTTDA